MNRKNNKFPLYEKLEITDIAAEGKAIARKDEMVIFVNNVVPGDVVDVQINKRKKNYKEGYPVFFHEYSKDRITPFCEHFGLCGGCKWQSLPYEKQLYYKEKQVSDQLIRIGGLELPGIEPIKGSVKTTFYRNKLEYTFSNNRWLTSEEIKNDTDKENRDIRALGFHIPGMYDRIIDINSCHLQPEPSNSIRLEVKKFTAQNNYSFFNHRKKEGYLRNLIIRTTSIGEVMIIISLFSYDKEKQEALLNHLWSTFSNITSLMYVINDKLNDSITDLDIVLHKGRDHIFEEMEGLKFKIGPKSFYQTNSDQAYELYKEVRELCDLQGDEIVYDLYTGTGTIANFIASKAALVVGIEYVPEAIEDAKVNSEINNIANTKFYAGDIKDIMTRDFFKKNGRPDIIILDPPRAGIHKHVAESLIYGNPSKIVYVSCNPATQARDLSLLKNNYEIQRVQPVDMFPHTHHVENIVLLTRK